MPPKEIETAWERGHAEIETWFERDRQQISIRDPFTDTTLAEWWDEDVDDLVDGGFIDVREAILGATQHLGKKFEQSVVAYADQIGVKMPRGWWGVVEAFEPGGSVDFLEDDGLILFPKLPPKAWLREERELRGLEDHESLRLALFREYPTDIDTSIADRFIEL